jgi:hypothetical protein
MRNSSPFICRRLGLPARSSLLEVEVHGQVVSAGVSAMGPEGLKKRTGILGAVVEDPFVFVVAVTQEEGCHMPWALHRPAGEKRTAGSVLRGALGGIGSFSAAVNVLE